MNKIKIFISSSILAIFSCFAFSGTPNKSEDIPQFAPKGMVAYAASYSSNPTSEPKYSTQNSTTFQYMNLGDSLNQYRGDSVKVGIIDSGINYDHEDFMVDSSTVVKGDSKYYSYTGSSWVYYGASSHGYSYIDDTLGHGTNVAATVAAAINGVGGTGIAPNVDLYVYKVTNSSNGYEFGAIQNALMDAKTLGIDVINMSFQSYEHAVSYNSSSMAASSGCSTILSYYINQAYNAGITLVAAAGNYNTDEPSYPGSNSNVINVGSLNSTGTDKAPFSNYGSTIDLVAPGYVYVADEASNSAYTNTQGTSFSAPLVTGAIALYKQKNPSATPAQIESALYASCDAIDDSGSQYTNWAGHGSLNLAKFLGLQEDVPTEIVINNPEITDEELSLEVGDTFTLDWTVNGTGTFDDSVNFYTLDEGIVSVDSNGQITALSEGSDYVVIESNVDSNVYTSVYVTVTTPAGPTPTVSSVTVSPANLSLDLNGTKTANLSATVNGENNPAQTVTWSSSNANVATVSASGVVTAIATGSTTITATSTVDDTKSGSCSVTISDSSSVTPETLVITRNSFSGSGGYAWYNWSQATSNDETITGKGELYTTTTSSMQFNKSNGNKVAAVYNSDPIPGSITKIEAQTASGTNRQWMAYVTSTACTSSGSTLTFGSNKTTVGGATVSTSITSLGTSNAGYSYFCLQEYETGASYLSQIKITYTPSSTAKLTAITLDTSSVQKAFVEGDTFNTNNLVVTAHYDDSSKDGIVTPTEISTPDMTVTGEKTITVTYKSVSATYTINVAKGTLSSIAVSGQTTNYSKGSSFSFDGTCTATFANGYQKEVTPTSVSSPDMSTGGVKTITVSYTYNGVTKTVTYDITVSASRTVYEEVSSSLSSTITWPSSATASISGELHNVTASLSGKTNYESQSIRLGTGSGGGTLSISATETITSVTISAKYYSSSYSSSVLKVDGRSVSPLSSSYSSYSVTLTTGKTSFTISTDNSSNRVNIQSITLYSSTKVVTDISNTEDCIGLENYITTYLHMDDYTEDKGWCMDNEHNYYGKNTTTGAKYNFNQLNTHQKQLLSSNSAYEAEWARLTAWAKANGDILDSSNNFVNAKAPSLLESVSNNMSAILIIVSVISVTVLAGYFTLSLRKRKQQ